MLWAAIGMRIFGDNVAEWQIDAVKKDAAKLNEEEMEHTALTPAEKNDRKRVWRGGGFAGTMAMMVCG